jgi:hypothetical protein
LLTLVITLTGYQPEARAATVNAASCSPADVQKAVNVAVGGDTVVLPACTYTNWNTTVTITKSLKLTGKGMGQTVLQRARVAAGYENNEMFRVKNVKGFEMRHMTLDGTQDTNLNQWVDFAVFLLNCVDFRIHHMAFADFAVALQVRGDPTVQRGLVDHNTFTDIWWKNNSTGQAFGYGVSIVGNGTYPALALGTSQNVFIEDNTFTRNRHAVASNNGTRYVFRYNTIIDNREDAQAIDAHGKVSTWPQGSRQYEIYHNRVTNAVARFAGVYVSGGDGVIFNNSFSQNLYREIVLDDASGCSSGSYPLEDQIRAVYLWGNVLNEGGQASIKVDTGCESFVKLNRDYFLSKRPNYTSYTYPHPLTQSGSSPPAPLNLVVK